MKIRVISLMVLTTIIYFTTNNSIAIRAETIDDLRELVGEQRLDSESTIKNIKDIIVNKEITDGSKGMADRVSILEENINKTNREKLDKLIGEKEAKDLELLNIISNDGSFDDIMEIVVDIEDILKNIDYADIDDIEIITNEDKYEDIEKDYEKALDILGSIEDNIDIGDIGWGLNPPTKGIFKVAEPFGEYLSEYGNGDKVRNMFIELYTLMNEDTDIVSQWNGKATKIGNGSVEIEHGYGLKTRYSNLRGINVNIGDKVNQYDKIGVADGDRIRLEIILDGKSIDPLKVYGVEGVREYFNWVQSNPSRIIELNDMDDVKNKISNRQLVETENIGRDSDSLKGSDDLIGATLPDDYTPPKPGIIQ